MSNYQKFEPLEIEEKKEGKEIKMQNQASDFQPKIHLFFIGLFISDIIFLFSLFHLPIINESPLKLSILCTIGGLLFIASFGFLKQSNEFLDHFNQKENKIYFRIYICSICISFLSSYFFYSIFLSLFLNVVQVSIH